MKNIFKNIFRKIKVRYQILQIQSFAIKKEKLNFRINLKDLILIKEKYLKILGDRFYKNELMPIIKRGFTQKKSPVSIMYINTTFEKGGAANILLKIQKGINNENYRSKLVVSNIDSKNKDLICLNKISFSRKEKYLREYQHNEGLIDFFNIRSFEIKNLKEFKEIDILHFHNLHGNYFSFFALPELTSLRPCVWTLHDMQSFTGHCAHSFDCDKWQTGCGNCPDLTIYPEVIKDSTAFVWENKKKVYEKCKLIIVCPSKWLKEKIEKSILKDQDIRLIYNGIDEKIFINTEKRKAKEKLNLPLDKKILMFSAHGGKDNFWKGGDYLVRAYEILKNRNDILFINLGGYTPDEGRDNWKNVNYISDENLLALYYSAADLFIYPSLAEVFGLVVAESLSCGTPVITFRTGGIPEIIEHMKTGYIADYKDIDDFVNGINIFLDNDLLRKEAGVEGRNTVIKKFRVIDMVKSYERIYEELVNNKGK